MFELRFTMLKFLWTLQIKFFFLLKKNIQAWEISSRCLWPSDCQDSHDIMASSPRTHAAATLELFQGQAQMMFLWALLYPYRYWLHMVYMVSTSLGRAVPTVGLSLTIQPNTLGCLRSTYDLCPSHPDGFTQDISIPLENIHPLILTCISSSLDIHHPYFCAYWKCKKKKKKDWEWKRERDWILLVLLLFPLRNHLSFCTLCVFTLRAEDQQNHPKDIRATDKLRVIMESKLAGNGHL